MEAPGRIFQDDHFEVAQLRGQLVERIGYVLIGQKPAPDGYILCVKPHGGAWNRGFLDAGIAFWEDWGDTGLIPDDVDEDDDVRFVDCSESFASLVIRRVSAWAEPDRTSRLAIEFEDGGRLELSCVDESDIESAHLALVSATV